MSQANQNTDERVPFRKRILLKFRWKIARKKATKRKKQLETLPLTEPQKIAIVVIKDAVKDPSSEILILPYRDDVATSGLKYYIDWPKREVTVAMTKWKITVANGVYSDDVSIDDKIFKLLTEIIERRIQTRCNALDAKLLENMKKRLTAVVDKSKPNNNADII